MPLKYLADWPLGVQVVGWVHGVLFLAYLAVTAWAWWRGLRTKLAAAYAIAAVLPGGPFVVDRWL